MKKTFLIVLLIIFATICLAEKTIEFPRLKRPGDLVIDKDCIYISDCPHIYIYSLKNFKLVKKFGREGVGPGEFKPTVIHFKINVQPGYIFVNSTHKASFFSRDGKLLREMNAANAGHSFTAFGEILVGRKTIREGKNNWETLTLFDSKLNPIKELSRIPYSIEEKGIKVFHSGAIVEGSKDKIFISMGSGFEIKIFNYKGGLLHTIKREALKDRVKINDSHKKGLHEYLKLRWRGYPGIKDKLIFPEYLPALWSMKYCADEEKNEKLYVVTRKALGDKQECFVYNTGGKLLEKIYLPLKEKDVLHLFPFDIKGGKLYRLIENEETETYELLITEI